MRFGRALGELGHMPRIGRLLDHGDPSAQMHHLDCRLADSAPVAKPGALAPATGAVIN